MDSIERTADEVGVPTADESRLRSAESSRTTGRGEAAATIEALFTLHEARLGQFLAQVVRSRSLADDLLQETFLAAYCDRDKLSSVDNVEAWLFAIARNRALSALRGWRRGRAALERLAWHTNEELDSDPAEAAAVRDLLSRCLKPEDRTLVVLRYVHGFSASELSVMTGRTPDGVRQRLARACARLLKELDVRAENEDEAGASGTDIKESTDD